MTAGSGATSTHECGHCGPLHPSETIHGDWHVVVEHDAYGAPEQVQCGPVRLIPSADSGVSGGAA